MFEVQEFKTFSVPDINRKLYKCVKNPVSLLQTINISKII